MNNPPWRTLAHWAHLVEIPQCVLCLNVSPLLKSCGISSHTGENLVSLLEPSHHRRRSPWRSVPDSKAWRADFVVMKSFVCLNSTVHYLWRRSCFTLNGDTQAQTDRWYTNMHTGSVQTLCFDRIVFFFTDHSQHFHDGLKGWIYNVKKKKRL